MNTLFTFHPQQGKEQLFMNFSLHPKRTGKHIHLSEETRDFVSFVDWYRICYTLNVLSLLDCLQDFSIEAYSLNQELKLENEHN